MVMMMMMMVYVRFLGHFFSFKNRWRRYALNTRSGIKTDIICTQVNIIIGTRVANEEMQQKMNETSERYRERSPTANQTTTGGRTTIIIICISVAEIYTIYWDLYSSQPEKIERRKRIKIIWRCVCLHGEEKKRHIEKSVSHNYKKEKEKYKWCQQSANRCLVTWLFLYLRLVFDIFHIITSYFFFFSIFTSF